MAEVDPVVLELRAELGRYKAELRNTTTSVEQLLGRQEKSAKRLEAEMKRSSGAIGNTLKGLAGSLAAAFGTREIIGLVDNFTRLQNALKVAGLEGEELARVQQKLFDLGARYGVSVNALADLYGKAEQAGRELGASQAELVSLTEAVSQSILITGTSTEQASGAILGLTQALASGTVRAEEFNQVNEGGLRPLLEAAAASERFGGSIAKLRNEVVNGTVSSQEFYRAILDGANLVENKAANATLTLSGAFQALSDQFARYFGEAGQGSGATEALASAIQALAGSLDVIIPALATIAAAMGVQMVAGAVAGSRAVFALTAAMGGAATATEALAFAMAGISKTLPLIAITALVAGIGYLIVKSNEATQATGQYREVLDASKKAQDTAREAAERLASAHGKTREEALAAARAERENTKQKLAGARASLILAQAELKKARAFQAAQNQASIGATGVPGTGLFIQGTGDTKVAQAQANLAANERAIGNLEGALKELSATIAGGAPPKVSSVSADPKKTKAKNGRSGGATGPTAAETAERQEQELARLRQEEIQAKIALVDNADERAALERDLLAEEFAARRAQIQADEDLNAQQKAAQIGILESLYGVQRASEDGQAIIVQANKSLYAQAIERERLAQIEREEADLAAERFQSEAEALRLQYDLADTQDQRRAIALSILDAEDRYLKSKLEAVLASEVATEAEKERARIALEAVNATSADRRAAVNRSEAGALDRYAQSLSDPKQRVEEAVVRQLERVNEGITDAITKALGVDDPLISELLDILLQEVLFKPLAESLSGAASGGGGGFIQVARGVLGAIFGGARAAGGSVSPGHAYLVGERGRELFTPDQPGTIIPNSRLNGMGGNSQGGVVKLVIEEGPQFASRVRAEATGVAIEVQRAAAPQVIDAAANETARRFNRPRL